jgi:Tol biopolymer transport system component
MMRILLGFIGKMIFGCIGLVLLAWGIGRVLPPEDEIVFSANLDNRNYEIYRMALGRRLMARLTDNDADDRDPTWSPDGQQIAFVNAFARQYRIFLMDGLGGTPHRLTNSNSDEYAPAWSPDGQYVAYENLIYCFASQIVMTDLQSGRVTRLSGADSGSNSVAWSFDNHLIAFASDPGNLGDEDIYTVDVQNGAIRSLISSDAYEANPAWSPDGHYLSYTGKSIDPRIYLWDRLQGKSILLYKPTVPNSIILSVPKWSPDSRHLVYTIGRNGSTAIFQLDVATCLQDMTHCIPQLMTPKPGMYTDPDWWPRQS